MTLLSDGAVTPVAVAPSGVSPAVVVFRGVGVPNAPSGPDFSAFADDFEGESLDEKWDIQPDGCVAFSTVTVASGYVHLPIANGGSIGSLWDNRNDGALMAQTITGTAWDARARVTVRNLLDTGNPGTTGDRLVGLAAHDPDRSGGFFNYVAIAVGRSSGALRIHALTTDDSGGGSATTTTEQPFAGRPSPSDAAHTADLRIVRQGQVFSLYEKGTGTALDSDDDWNLVWEPIDREDDDAPARGGDGIAVALPDTLELGIAVWSTVTTSDLSARVLDFLVKAAPS